MLVFIPVERSLTCNTSIEFNFNNLINIFKDKEVVSSGVVAIPHNAKRHKYTQYCGKLLCKSQKLGIVEIDIEFYIYWNSDFSSKK